MIAKQCLTLRVKLWNVSMQQSALKPLNIMILPYDSRVRKRSKLLTVVFTVGRVKDNYKDVLYSFLSCLPHLYIKIEPCFVAQANSATGKERYHTAQGTMPSISYNLSNISSACGCCPHLQSPHALDVISPRLSQSLYDVT